MLALLPLIASIVQAIIGKFPDPAQKAAMNAAANAAIQAHESQVAAAEKAYADAMSKVMAADAASESWMTRNARPFTVFWAIALATWIIVAGPALGVTNATLQAISAVPDMLWTLMTVGIGAYPFARAIEKGIKGR